MAVQIGYPDEKRASGSLPPWKGHLGGAPVRPARSYGLYAHAASNARSVNSL